jgi:hypothetical protein
MIEHAFRQCEGFESIGVSSCVTEKKTVRLHRLWWI